ncbi:MAG: hypothetical protein U0836_27590 [Pirellulales bacterium]
MSLLVLSGALLAAGAAEATVLTFDAGVLYTEYVSNGKTLVQNHGDRVTATAQGPNSYGKGSGWTPNVTVEYSPSMQFRSAAVNWGGLDLPAAVTYDGLISITLRADEGWDVALESLAVASRNDDRTLEHVIIWDAGTNESLALESSGAAPAQAPRTVDLPPSARGKALRLEIATGDPAGWDWVAIDDLSFSQVPTGYSLGDANQDHAVDLADFGILKANFGKAFASQAWGQGDFNLDRKVDLEDFATLKESFGSRTAAAVVPEPSGAALATLGLLGAMMMGWLLRRHIPAR